MSLLRLVAVAIVVLLGGCTDAFLYGVGSEDPSPDRLGLSGRVCTDDAAEAGFPVKIIFLVDVANGPVFAWDSEQIRLQAIRDALSIHEGNEDFSFAVISMGGTARLLAPLKGGFFTQDPGELDGAVSTLAVPQPCIGTVCRDYDGALGLAKSIIEGDLADLYAGERSRTQYVIVSMLGGPPDPLACYEDCCDDGDTSCDGGFCTPDQDCTITTQRDTIAGLRTEVQEAGALSLTFHALLLAAPDKSDKTWFATLDWTETLLGQMSFAGAGTFERFNVADAITLDRVGLLKLTSLLEAKALMVTNRNTVPTVKGPVLDSDGDGLSDEYEDTIGTSKTLFDSDADGLGDQTELLLSLNALQPEKAPPQACEAIPGPPYEDSDLDTLNDCEEALLGTNATLPDTDGDGVLDWFELIYGTDYLRDDSLGDADSDGSTNGDELLNHTDPRSSDANSHLADAYRYEVTDEGFVSEPTVFGPNDITGVTILSAGADTVGGLGTLRVVVGSPPALSWQDAGDDSPGAAIEIEAPGSYTLQSSSVVTEGADRWLQVDVEPSLFPPTNVDERLLVQLSERHCVSFTVRNVRLMETVEDGGGGGINNVFIYFAEAPKDRLTVPGLFRAVHVPVEYHAATGRDPAEPIIEVTDGEFTSIGF
jgi:hypothetical protein